MANVVLKMVKDKGGDKKDAVVTHPKPVADELVRAGFAVLYTPDEDKRPARPAVPTVPKADHEATKKELAEVEAANDRLETEKRVLADENKKLADELKRAKDELVKAQAAARK